MSRPKEKFRESPKDFEQFTEWAIRQGLDLESDDDDDPDLTDEQRLKIKEAKALNKKKRTIRKHKID